MQANIFYSFWKSWMGEGHSLPYTMCIKEKITETSTRPQISVSTVGMYNSDVQYSVTRADKGQ